MIEKSALLTSLLLKQSIRHVSGLSKLDCLRMVFDAGNHFRSYETCRTLLVEIPQKHAQRCVTSFLVEKHGKGPCDAEIFSVCRSWLREYLMQPGAFIDSEEKLVQVLQTAAANAMRKNPDGPRFLIRIPELPQARPSSKTMTMDNCQLLRSYCWESIPGGRKVRIRNWVFSDATASEDVSYRVHDNPEHTDWRKGYWQDGPGWRRPPLELDEDNSVTRNHAAQWHRFSRFEDFRHTREDTLQQLCQRDEERLQRRKRRREEMAVEEDSDVSI